MENLGVIIVDETLAFISILLYMYYSLYVMTGSSVRAMSLLLHSKILLPSNH